jgi:hypothetical protein
MIEIRLNTRVLISLVFIYTITCNVQWVHIITPYSKENLTLIYEEDVYRLDILNSSLYLRYTIFYDINISGILTAQIWTKDCYSTILF